jgi:hypothetical protein
LGFSSRVVEVEVEVEVEAEGLESKSSVAATTRASCEGIAAVGAADGDIVGDSLTIRLFSFVRSFVCLFVRLFVFGNRVVEFQRLCFRNSFFFRVGSSVLFLVSKKVVRSCIV